MGGFGSVCCLLRVVIVIVIYCLVKCENGVFDMRIMLFFGCVMFVLLLFFLYVDVCIFLLGVFLYVIVCFLIVLRFVMSLCFEDIQVFFNVVELGSISVVVECMSLFKFVISKCVSDLECYFGVCLFYCLMCNVELIEVGGFFYKLVKVLLQDLNNVVESVVLCENDLCGELWVMVLMSFGMFWLGLLVMEFMVCNLCLEVVL